MIGHIVVAQSNQVGIEEEAKKLGRPSWPSLQLAFHQDHGETGLPKAVVPNFGPPDVLGLHLPEAFTIPSAGQDFWELKSKNLWRAKVGHH